MSLNGNWGKTGQTNLIFCMMLPVGVVLCMLCQNRVFPTLAAIIAARCRGMLATNPCRRSTQISDHLSNMAWQISPKYWGGLSILLIAWPYSCQICFVGLQSGDLARCSILVTLPCLMISRTTSANWGVVLLSYSFLPLDLFFRIRYCTYYHQSLCVKIIISPPGYLTR